MIKSNGNIIIFLLVLTYDLAEFDSINAKIYWLGDWNVHLGKMVKDYHEPSNENDYGFINFVNKNNLINLNLHFINNQDSVYTREKLTHHNGVPHISRSVLDYGITNDINSINQNNVLFK